MGLIQVKFPLVKLKLAKEAAQKLQCTVVVSGAQDAISDGVRTATIDNGDLLLTKVTGTGCMTTSLIGSFCRRNE